MSRSYLVGSWLNADEYDYTGYSGEMLMGHRNGASRELDHFMKDGRANVAKYGDNTIKPKIHIKDKILPQGKRLVTLREQMLELENSYRSGELDIHDYSVLRDIIVAKIQRQEVLYKRAASVKPKSSETDEDSDLFHTSSGLSPQPDGGYASEEYDDCGVEFIDSLSNGNSFKKILQKGCKGVRTLVKWHQASKRYIKTLKEV